MRIVVQQLNTNIFFHQLFLPKYLSKKYVALCFLLRAHLAFCLQTSAFTGTFEASSIKGLSLEVLPISLIKTNQTIFKRSTFYQYCNFGKLSNLGGKTGMQQWCLFKCKGCVIFSELLRLRGNASTRENATNQPTVTHTYVMHFQTLLHP